MYEQQIFPYLYDFASIIELIFSGKLHIDLYIIKTFGLFFFIENFKFCKKKTKKIFSIKTPFEIRIII